VSQIPVAAEYQALFFPFVKQKETKSYLEIIWSGRG